jgi:hypothetical protein
MPGKAGCTEPVRPDATCHGPAQRSSRMVRHSGQSVPGDNCGRWASALSGQSGIAFVKLGNATSTRVSTLIQIKLANWSGDQGQRGWATTSTKRMPPCNAFFSLQPSQLLPLSRSPHQRRRSRPPAIACKGPVGAIQAIASSEPLPNAGPVHPAQTPVAASIHDMRTHAKRGPSSSPLRTTAGTTMLGTITTVGTTGVGTTTATRTIVEVWLAARTQVRTGPRSRRCRLSPRRAGSAILMQTARRRRRSDGQRCRSRAAPASPWR